MNHEQIINLQSDDGRAYRCRLLVVFPFEEKEYALLQNLETPGTVIMQLIEQGDQATFRTIESDEQFARVTAHCKEVLRELAEEEE